ncbi:ABC transporter ATP-binding protein [Dethiosulfovibrio salsuginis]|uniref:Nucleoside ABC transporter ATP-binding protein n=1 Tax=Dethiosulfovibrio salsuginis TaxID=561720 RepID=A0A1X7K9B8_9BACT|nr:ABC transporter ATP-binding protein [Dethiosulfovibrio salsuginis]SMG37304.1 nucleoside ABC transporter ATP-binding protein [Dethiosulfovibrio salsuginis]
MKGQEPDGVPAVELKGITKYFPGTVANEDVHISVKKGEVLALLGENGAGKTTLMRILYGMYRQDQGKILVDGSSVRIDSPQDAMALGIGMIHQHFSLVPVHSVAENVVLGLGSSMDRLDLERVSSELRELGSRYGLEVDPYGKVGQLPVGMQQRVEIVKALYRKARILIMDEPTAVLTPQETERLGEFVREFTSQGNSVILITHKLGEVMAMADSVTVMRAGKVVGSVSTAESSERELARMMVGRDLELVSGHREGLPGEPVLSVLDLTVKDDRGSIALNGLSLTVGRGEIFGIAGVSGNGQQELAEAICGLRAPVDGSITLNGRDITGLSVKEIIASGVGYIPADRHKDGLVLDMSVEENFILKNSGDRPYFRSGVMDGGSIGEHGAALVGRFSIKAPSPSTKAKALSGGNQQKVVIAREIGLGSSLLVAVQPIRGLDLGAADYVHSVLMEERSKGKAILLISTELSEVLTLSDRVGVIYGGRILDVLDRSDMDVDRIGLLMAGVEEVHHG